MMKHSDLETRNNCRYHLLFLLIAIMQGCVAIPANTKVDNQNTEINYSASEYIVILTTGQNIEGHRLGSCIEESIIEKNSGELRLLRSSAFINKMFPWFESDTFPKDDKEFQKLLSKSYVANKLASENIRYLITLFGTNVTIDEISAFQCSAGFGAAGCLGLLKEKNSTKVNAMVWESVSRNVINELSLKSTGNTTIIGFVIPFGVYADTEKAACKQLTDSIFTLFNNKK